MNRYLPADKPWSEACEENQAPILAVLRGCFADCSHILEIGSGTGQHAVHFGAALPHLHWQTSDRAQNHPGIQAWLNEARLPNVAPPLHLDVARDPWPDLDIDGVFSANTAHIMSFAEVERMFLGVGRLLPDGGVFALYGPFRYGGRHTSESNARFDVYLKHRDPASGVRDLDDLTRIAVQAGMQLSEDVAMPVNNRTLIWHRQG